MNLYLMDLAESLDKITYKHYLKMCNFYFQLLFKWLATIRKITILWTANFEEKIGEFLSDRIQHFLELKPINHSTEIKDLVMYLDIIELWAEIPSVYCRLETVKTRII